MRVTARAGRFEFDLYRVRNANKSAERGDIMKRRKRLCYSVILEMEAGVSSAVVNVYISADDLVSLSNLVCGLGKFGKNYILFFIFIANLGNCALPGPIYPTIMLSSSALNKYN